VGDKVGWRCAAPRLGPSRLPRALMKAKTLSIALAAALMVGGVATVHASDLAPLEARAAAGDSAAMVDLGEALLARDRPVEGLMYLENVIILGRPEED